MNEFILNIMLLAMVPILYYFLIIHIGMRKNKKNYEPRKSTYKKENLLKDLIFNLPYRIGKDIAEKDPNFFDPQGIIVFTGTQGSGKTMSMIKYATDLKAQYPRAKIVSNTDYKYQDKELDRWQVLTDYNNGTDGVIVIWDEIQNTFNSRLFKDWPIEMTGVVTQNRKNKRIILCTAQQLYMLDKNLRTQMSFEYQCRCFMGCLNLVIKNRPIVDSTGEIVKKIPKGFYMYLQTDELRNSYDTFKVIDVVKKKGLFDRKRVENEDKK